eukprot:1504197-Prymnesium_polylepis.1
MRRALRGGAADGGGRDVLEEAAHLIHEALVNPISKRIDYSMSWRALTNAAHPTAPTRSPHPNPTPSPHASS